MKRFLSAAAVLVALLCLSFADAGVRQEVVDPAVIVSDSTGLGSGVLVEVNPGELLVLTAAHVVDSAVNGLGEGEDVREMDLQFRDGRKMKGLPVFWFNGWRAGGRDLALIKPLGNLNGLKPAALAPRDVQFEEGDPLYFCGAGGGFPWSLERTIVNQYDDRFITFNGIGWYGHSGSGLYLKPEGSKKWRLVGIVVHFVQSPRDNPRCPVQAERQLHEFLRDYQQSKVK